MYDFTQLSPADFEELTRDLLQAHWGVRLEAFRTGRDQGIDLRYSVVPGQSLIVQCKHFVRSTLRSLVRELKLIERPKTVRLNPTRYVLTTSLPLSPAQKDQIVEALQPYVHTPHDIYGAEDLNNLLRCYPSIETQHFKLWMSSTVVLQTVLHNATRVQTDFDVDRVLRAMPRYVQTSNFARAQKILAAHNVLIISGVPGIGKTTLADMLLFAHLQAGYQPVVAKVEINEAKDLYRTNALQVFYFDDFLGQTFLGNRIDFLGKREDAAILDFIDLIARSKHAKFILTTREHILRHAFQLSEHFRRKRRDLDERHFILELDDYSLLNRARILYNHIYFSDLLPAYKRALLREEFYLQILKHRNFNPRLIEWLSRFTNIKIIPARHYQREVQRVLDNPEELWAIAFEQQISEAARSVLLALYSLGGNAELRVLEDTWKELHRHRAQKYNWKRTAQDWRQALHDLDGGFLAYRDGQATFINPSVKDFLDTRLCTDTDHLDDILASACEFRQVLTIWGIAVSEKGNTLQAYFRRKPQGLMDAALKNLTCAPHPLLAMTRPHDTAPEVRLHTMISVTNYMRSDLLLKTLTDYVNRLASIWSQVGPNMTTTAQLLIDLDHAPWSKLRESKLHGIIKAAIIKRLTTWPRSAYLTAIIDYAHRQDARWSAIDEKALACAARTYLDDEFNRELADATTKEELETLALRLEDIGSYCDITVWRQSNIIQDAIDSIPREAEEEGPSLHTWNEHDTSQVSEAGQEAEIRRLFDGLSFKTTRDVPRAPA